MHFSLLICVGKMRLYLALLLWQQLLFSAVQANRHYFTSTSHLAQLTSMKFRLAEALLGYANNETMRLDRVREFARSLQQSSQEGVETKTAAGERLVEHPVEAFLTIKRMGQEWKRLLGNCNDAPNALLRSAGLELPTSDDYDGAADALLRLQDVYGISAESMARGQLTVGSDGMETDRSAPMLLSAEDCLTLVNRAFHRNHDLIGMQWIRLIMTAQFPSDETGTIISAVVDILQRRFESIPRDNVAITTEITNIWRRHHSNATALAQQVGQISPMVMNKQRDVENYRKLCKDGSYKSNRSSSHLVCRYTVPHPFFTLAPQKEELLSENPRVVFLYDLLTDGESNRLVEVADTRLQRAQVIGGKFTDIRISKSAFMTDNEDWSIRKVNRKLGAATGLNVTNSDLLQMGNYGIGGQYEPHMDSFGFGITHGNNRVATVLLYLNNVKQGGGTVFPRLGLRVLPVKNGALFWYNMRRNSSDIFDTTHAACPVLEGSKWVANKWIYYLGQMHHRPCSLNQFD